jgi:hypothetical protein
VSKNERADIHVRGQEVLPGVAGIAGASGVRGGGDADDDLSEQKENIRKRFYWIMSYEEGWSRLSVEVIDYWGRDRGKYFRQFRKVWRWKSRVALCWITKWERGFSIAMSTFPVKMTRSSVISATLFTSLTQNYRDMFKMFIIWSVKIVISAMRYLREKTTRVNTRKMYMVVWGLLALLVENSSHALMHWKDTS